MKSEKGNANQTPFSPNRGGKIISPNTTKIVLLKTESILAAFDLSLDCKNDISIKFAPTKIIAHEYKLNPCHTFLQVYYLQ